MNPFFQFWILADADQEFLVELSGSAAARSGRVRHRAGMLLRGRKRLCPVHVKHKESGGNHAK
jgi:hypothetical protein